MAQPVHTSTGAAPPGGHAGVFPPFASTTFASQLLWFAITFGVLYYVMSRIALPQVAAVLHNRAERISRDLQEAQALRTQSEEAGAAYEKSLADAGNKAKAIAQQTRDALNAEAEGKRKTLEAELAQKLAAAETTIRSRTAEAMGNVRGIAADTASVIVQRLTGQAPDPAAIQAALDRQTTTA
jgi:F-type H+-transporting ATPase subunit b